MKKVNQEISNDISRKSDFSFEVTGQTGKVTHFAPREHRHCSTRCAAKTRVFVPTPRLQAKHIPLIKS